MGVNIDILGPALAAAGVTARPSDTRVLGALDTWFKDCTDDVTDDGTAHEAAYHNSVLANLRSVIRGNGLTAGGDDVVALDNADDMIWRACQHLYQRNQPRYADDTGVANSVIMALTPAPAEIKKGMRISTKIAADNTGAAMTLTLNTVVKDIKTIGGLNPTKGMFIAGQHATFEYTGVHWQLVSPASETMVFTPVASFTTALVSSIPHSTFVNAPVTLQSFSNMSTPVINGGGTSWSVPAGQYMIATNVPVRVVVNNNTQTGGLVSLFKNGVSQDTVAEHTSLLASQDLTMYPQLVAFFTSAGLGDLFQVCGYSGATLIGDYNLGQILAGKFKIMRIGN